jgi:hypothetical protein
MMYCFFYRTGTRENFEWHTSEPCRKEDLPRVREQLEFEHGEDAVRGPNTEVSAKSIGPPETFDRDDPLPYTAFDYVQNIGHVGGGEMGHI